MSFHNYTGRRSFAATLEHLTKPLSDPHVLLTAEAIAFQNNDQFGPDLEVIVNKYKALVEAGASRKAIEFNKELREELHTAVKNRLGLTVKLTTNNYLAAVVPNVLVPNNAVINSDYRDWFEYFEEVGETNMLPNNTENNFVIGGVNTQKAKVTGWFSERPVPLFINFHDLFLTYDCTVPEVVAIILHELGHAFEAVVYCANVNTTNQILSDLVRYIKSDRKDVDINYIYTKLKQIDKDSTRELAEGLASKDAIVLSMSSYRLVVGVTRSLMSSASYDRTTFESLADLFASRFGYGVPLVTGLEKLEAQYTEYASHKYMFMEFVALMVRLTIASVGLIIGSIFSFANKNMLAGLYTAFLAALIGFVMMLMVNAQRVTKKDMTYDNIRDRYMRVRNQHIEMIKTVPMPKEASVAVLEQIKAMDKIISQKKVFENPLTKMSIALFPSDRRAASDIRYQQEIERMMSNDIFLQAQRLKNME